MATKKQAVETHCRLGVEYFDKVAPTYSEQIDSNYHRHRIAVIESMLTGLDLSGKLCIDFGCGEGVSCELLAKRGATVIGIEPSNVLLRKAHDKYHGDGRISFVHGGVDELLHMSKKSADLVAALNVLAYLTSEEERHFYSGAHDVLSDHDGMLLVTHSNELFDMYTFNKYTVNFFDKHFSMQNERCDVSGLLTNPEKPARGFLNIRENPLSYKFKLKAFGFEELKQNFAMYHKRPPLLLEGFAPDDLARREFVDTLNWPEQDAWKLMFQCSVFASLSRKQVAS